jgi:hypothetical protein
MPQFRALSSQKIQLTCLIRALIALRQMSRSPSSFVATLLDRAIREQIVLKRGALTFA